MGRQLNYIGTLAACALVACLQSSVNAGKVGSGLSMTGHSTLTYRWQDAKGLPGGLSLFRGDYLYLSPGVERQSDLLVNGEVLPGLRLDASMARTYLGNESRWTLGYGFGDADLALGDITATLDGNPLLEMRRSLKGLRLQGKIPGGEFTMVASQAKAPVRTDTFFGRNTSGPYYLTASPIVDGTERVELDGAPLSRGRDYSLDYDIGLLQFDPSIIVPPTSRVTVTYEHFAPGGAGRLMAMRMSHSSGRVTVGTTYASIGKRNAPSSWARRDRWLGNNSIGPFTLSQRPVVPGSDEVLVAGLVQTRDLHYQVDYAAGRITFMFPITLGTPVEVLYRVRAENKPGGDERLMGLDLAFKPSKQTRLEGYLARSGLASGGGAGASEFRMAGDWQRLNVEARMRRASPSFSGLDGMERIDSERGVRIAYRPISHVSLSADLRNLRQPQFAYFGAAQGPLVARKEQDWRAEISVPGWPSLSYSRTRRSSRSLEGGAQPENSLTESLGLVYSRKVFGASANLLKTRATGVPFTTIGDSTPAAPYSAASRALRYNLWYRPSTRLNVTYDGGTSRLAAAGQGASVPAQSRRVAVSYSPSSKVNIMLSDVGQRTGAVSALSLPAYDTRMTMVSLQYTPSSKWSANLAADRQNFSGSGSTNSAAASLSGGLSLRPSEYVSVDMQLTRQNIASLAAGGKSANDIMSLGLHAGPWRRLTADLGFHQLNGILTGSFAPLGSPAGSAPAARGLAFPETAAYAVSATSTVRGRLAYDIGRRQSVFVEGERLRGSRYLAAGSTDAAAVGWQYRLTDQTSFTADFRRIRHRDPADSRRNYSANLFSAQLGFDF